MSLVAALLLGLAPQQAPQTAPGFQASLDPARAEEWIAFDWRPGGVITLEVRLDGKPVLALLDTGFPGVVLSRAYATAHQLPLSPGGETDSVGGKARYAFAPTPRLQVGGFEATGGRMIVNDFSAVAGYADRPFDLVLGAWLLARYTVEIDFDRRRLRLGARPGDNPGGTEIPLRFARSRFLVPLAVDGRPPVPAMLDLGATSRITLRADSPTAAQDAITDLAVAGVGGTAVHRLVRLNRAALGQFTLDEATAEIQPPDGFLARNGWEALIGIDLLGAYNLRLDVPNGKLTLVPRRRPDPPPPKSTTGIQGTYATDHMRVLHVMANSPAAAAGLRSGDRICAVDGQPVTAAWRTAPQRWTLAPPGRAYVVTLCDKRTVSLTTARFY